MSITVGVSKGSGASPKYGNYRRWLEEGHDDITVIDLSISEDLDADLARLDALVLSGGSDVDPLRYDNPEAEALCSDIDRERDAQEFRMLEVAMEREIPILAICRGAQILNVFQGGSLIPHLPAVVSGGERHEKEGERDNRHPVEVTPGTLLFKATGELSGEVNSAHHQALDRLGEGLKVAAKSDDGVVEAVEWANLNGKAYLLGVQWHPERMEDRESPFSLAIREQFLFEAESARILSGVSKPLPKSGPEPPPAAPEASEGSPLLPIIG